jgi:FeS assembly SUF system protein
MTDTNESNPAAGSEASTESTAPAEESKPEAGASEDLEGRIIEALRTCYDPEIPVNIHELGLIYDIDINPEGAVDIKMTLTSPACPVAGTLPPEVENKVAKVEGVSSAKVEVVWEPPWNPDKMTEAARLQLGMF